MSFPSKENRLTCWNHRDMYWKCLDENKTEDSCEKYKNEYEKFCPALWVKHFDKKRNYLVFKNRLDKEGFVPLFPEKEK